MGVALWVFDARRIRAVAVGTVPLTGLATTLSRFRPDAVHLESTRDSKLRAGKVPIPQGARHVFAHPEWRENRTHLPFLSRKSSLTANAWSLGFHQLFRRLGFTLAGTLPVEPLSEEWLSRWESK